MTAKFSPRSFLAGLIAIGFSAGASSLFAAEQPKSPPAATTRVPPSVANMPTITVKVSPALTLVPEGGLRGYLGATMNVGALISLDGGKTQPQAPERCRVEIQVAGWSPLVCEMKCAYIFPDSCDLPIPEGNNTGVRTLKARVKAFGRMGDSPWVTSTVTLEKSPTRLSVSSTPTSLPPAFAQAAALVAASEVTALLSKSSEHAFAGPPFLVNRPVVVSVDGGSVAGPIPSTGPDGRTTFLVVHPLNRSSSVKVSFAGDDSWAPSTASEATH